jgi:hypothetical protein
VGRIVPSWTDNELSLTIEPTGAAAIRTTVFKNDSSRPLDRNRLTRVGLEGKYVARLTTPDGTDVGWMQVDVNPESATRVTADLPSNVPPALAAAAAEAVDNEVAYIYGQVVDVNPEHR